MMNMRNLAAGAAAALVVSSPAFAATAGGSSVAGVDAANEQIVTVGAAILALVAVLATASIGIEFAWKGMTKSKQTVKKV